MERSQGHQFPVGPYMFGQKASFKPTENLELGFTRNDVFGGQGHVPLTFGSFWTSFTSINDVTPQVKFSRKDPGARHASFDFSYRLPLLRRWLTLYSDSLVHDDVSPVSAPQRVCGQSRNLSFPFPAFTQTRLPRRGGLYRSAWANQRISGQFIYWEIIYHDLYLNNKFLMGNWIGREGKGYQAWSTYHLSPQSSIQVGVRNSKIANDFIPGGSTQWDWNVSAMLRVRKDSRDQVLPAVRDLVGAGVGSHAANRFHQLCPTHLVADQRWDAQGIPLAWNPVDDPPTLRVAIPSLDFRHPTHADSIDLARSEEARYFSAPGNCTVPSASRRPAGGRGLIPLLVAVMRSKGIPAFNRELDHAVVEDWKRTLATTCLAVPTGELPIVRPGNESFSHILPGGSIPHPVGRKMNRLRNLHE